MKLLQHIIIPLALSSIVACQDYDAEHYIQQNVVGDSIYVQLTLDIASSATTRAGERPNGGEEGDGWEYGLKYENQLHNFTVFVLGNGADINADASTRFVGSRYFSEEEIGDSIRGKQIQPKEYDVIKNVLSYDFTIPIIRERQDHMPNPNTFRFYVVANSGDLTTTCQTVGDLRAAKPLKTWTAATTDSPTPSYFVMSNENDKYYASGAGSSIDPVRLHVTIERLAARIDYVPTGAEITADGLRYPIAAPPIQVVSAPTRADDDTPLAYLYVDRMAILNGSQQPTYFIKRVADAINSTDISYLGDETPTPRGVATNYVIDPYSAQKTEANRTNVTFLNTLFGASQISNAATLIASDAAKLPTVADTKSPIILGYVNENTFDKSMAWSEYTTGVIMQCRYFPVANYFSAYNPTQDGTVEAGVELDGLTPGTYTLGDDFWMVEPNQKYIDESDRFYFSNEEDAVAFATNTPQYRFGKVVKYTGGVCYYVIYMRHSNNVEVIHNTMEFGIVRNNIYRLRLNPTTGPGTPTIDPREPEELKARIYVRKWLSVEHPIIYV